MKSKTPQPFSGGGSSPAVAFTGGRSLSLSNVGRVESVCMNLLPGDDEIDVHLAAAKIRHGRLLSRIVAGSVSPAVMVKNAAMSRRREQPSPSVATPSPAAARSVSRRSSSIAHIATSINDGDGGERNESDAARAKRLQEEEAQRQRIIQQRALQRRKERKASEEDRQQSLALSFLACLDGDNDGGKILGRLRDMERLHATQAFSEIKPSKSGGGGGGATTTAVPVCHFPETRRAVMTLLGPESIHGTFNSSMLSGSLTTRLGVTVSAHVPDSWKGSADSERLDNASFRAKAADHGGFAGAFESMRLREIRANDLQMRQHDHHPFNGSSSSRQGDAYDDGDDDDDGDGEPGDLSRIRLSNLPGGQELESGIFDDVLVNGIKRAALDVMHRILGPRMAFLINRQRRFAVMAAPPSSSVTMKTHTQGTLHAMMVDLLRNRSSVCAPLAFALHQSGSSASADSIAAGGGGGGGAGAGLSVPAAHSGGRRYSHAGGGAAAYFSKIANQVGQASLSQKTAITSSTTNSSLLGLQFAQGADFSSSGSAASSVAPSAGGGAASPSSSSSSSALTSGGTMLPTQLASNYTAPLAPHLGSLFPSCFSHEAVHRLLSEGSLVVLPPNTQLCYQGEHICVRGGGGHALHAPAGTAASPLECPCIVVVLTGSVTASVQQVLPCGDAGMFIDKCQYELEPPKNDTAAATIKSVVHLLGGVKGPAVNDEETRSYEHKAAMRRSAAFEHFFKSKIDMDDVGTGDVGTSSSASTSTGGAGGNHHQHHGGGHHHHHHQGLATVSFSAFHHIRSQQIRSQPIFPIAPLLCRPRKRGEAQCGEERFHILKPTAATSAAVEKGSSSSSSSGGGGGGSALFISQSKGVAGNSSSSGDLLARTNRRSTSPTQQQRAGGDGLTDTARDRVTNIANAIMKSSNDSNGSSSNLHGNQRNNNLIKLNDAGSRSNNNDSSNSAVKNQSTTKSGVYNRITFLRSNLVPGSAVGPFGLPVSLGCLNSAVPYPVSLRTRTRCELFVVPHAALTRALHAHVSDALSSMSSSSTFSAVSSVSSSSLLHSDAERILISSLAHTFALSFFMTCSARNLSRIPFLKNVPSALRAAVASAFRPVMLVASSAYSTLSHFRSCLCVSRKASGALGPIGDFLPLASGSGGGADGAPSKQQKQTAATEHHPRQQMNMEPVGVLVLPMLGARCVVAMEESRTSAEPSVVSVDALARNAEEHTLRCFGAPSTVQHRLREGAGLELQSTPVGFGLREVFVTAGRRLEAMGEWIAENRMASDGNISSSKKRLSAEAAANSAAPVCHPGTSIHVFAGSRSDLAPVPSSPSPQPHHNYEPHSTAAARRKSSVSSFNSSASSSTGPVLCFVITAQDLQRQLSTALRGGSQELRTAAKTLFTDADAKMISYRVSAQNQTKEDESRSNNSNKLLPQQLQKSGGLHTVQPKSVHELLLLALQQFPFLGTLCRAVDRLDLLSTLSMLFEFKKYSKGQLILSKTEPAADRVLIVLRGKAVLLKSAEDADDTDDNRHVAASAQQQSRQVALSASRRNAVDDDDDDDNNDQDADSDHRPHKNEFVWKPLTVAGGATIALPHKWNRAAVAISEVTTAEANRSLVLAYLTDLGLLGAMKTLAAVAMCRRAISCVPNWEMPKIAQIGAAMLADPPQPEVHPSLPAIDRALLVNPLAMTLSKNSSSSTSSSHDKALANVQLPHFGSKQENALLAQRSAAEQQQRNYLEYVAATRLKTSNSTPVFSPSRSERRAAQEALELKHKREKDDGASSGGAGGGMPSSERDDRAAQRQRQQVQHQMLMAEDFAGKRRPEMDGLRLQPTRDAEELLRARGVLLKNEFFIATSIAPMTATVEPYSHRAHHQQQPHQTPPFPPQREPVARVVVTRDINTTHKSLSAGLWMRKRPKRT